MPNGKKTVRHWCWMEKRLFGTGPFRKKMANRHWSLSNIWSLIKKYWWKAPVPNSLFSIRHQSRIAIFPFGTGADRIRLLNIINWVNVHSAMFSFLLADIHTREAANWDRNVILSEWKIIQIYNTKHRELLHWMYILNNSENKRKYGLAVLVNY